jgi:hypothetical protein
VNGLHARVAASELFITRCFSEFVTSDTEAQPPFEKNRNIFHSWPVSCPVKVCARRANGGITAIIGWNMAARNFFENYETFSFFSCCNPALVSAWIASISGFSDRFVAEAIRSMNRMPFK